MTKPFYPSLKHFFENDFRALCGLFFLAFFLRLLFLPSLIEDPAFLQPLLDSKDHNWLAHELLNLNGWRMTQFWHHAPGYAYFVALVYKILGFSVVRLAVVQYILGSFSACLVFLLVKRLINRWAALFAGFLMSLYWILIYTQSHIFSENLSMVLNLLTVYFLIVCPDSWRKYLLCGTLLGLSLLFHSGTILFAGVLWVSLLSKRMTSKKVITYYGIFILGICLCVTPLLIRNYQLSGNFMFQKMTGMTLYIGSMPEYKGSTVYMTSHEWQDLVAKFFLEHEGKKLDREPTEKELNAFYTSKVVEYIKNQPLQWAAFIASKIGTILVGTDYLRSEDVYFYDKYIRGGPYSLIQTWFVCILALIGIRLALKREPQKFMIPLLFLASYLPALLFNYKSRFLVTHIPLLIIFSSYAVTVLIDLVRKRNLRELATYISAALALFTCVVWNPMNITWASKAETYHVIGSNFLYDENLDEAEQYFLKTLELDPMFVAALNDLGVTYMISGKFSLAAETFQRAIDLWPHPLFLTNHQIALKLLEKGGTYNQWEGYPEEQEKSMELYRHFFPNPYKGAIYQ